MVLYQHVHFSTRTIILWHHETGNQISQPSFEFKKMNSLVHNLLFELYNGIFFII